MTIACDNVQSRCLFALLLAVKVARYLSRRRGTCNAVTPCYRAQRGIKVSCERVVVRLGGWVGGYG